MDKANPTSPVINQLIITVSMVPITRHDTVFTMLLYFLSAITQFDIKKALPIIFRRALINT